MSTEDEAELDVRFKEALRDELMRHPSGLTWAELKEGLRLPYERPCPTWVRQLEQEIGLQRQTGTGKAKIWVLGSEPKK